MSNDRIENNPSYQKFNKELKGMEAINKVRKFFAFFGLKNKDLEEVFRKLPDMRQQLETISKSPDRFNDYFAQKGWIAHESMNSDLMLTSIELADKGLIDIAEQGLINYYSSEELRWRIHQFKSIEAFSIRFNFFLLAYEDTLAERYHAVVPILLMMIDGAVNDIDKGKGFFAENTNLTAWDSIAAHITGLTVLKEIFNSGRKKTTTEEISLPYRNGILHGRDLGYANKSVAAKCWAILFVIKDWADALEEGKKEPLLPEKELSFTESISQIKKILEQYTIDQKHNKIVSEKVAEWKPRQLSIGVDIPEKGTLTEYNDYTPEQEAIRFAEYWIKKNFGGIANQIHPYSKNSSNDKKTAGKVRKVFDGKKLTDYKILNISDISPKISVVTLAVFIEIDSNIFEKQIALRLLYEGDNEEILVFGMSGGQWKFIENFFHEIECLY